MKRIGIVGGIGPESTLEYYRRIIAAFHVPAGFPSHPEIIVYSGCLAELLDIQQRGDQAGLTGWLLEKIEALHRAGAEFAAIASNTPHQVFGQVSARSPLPLLSIVSATLERALELGLKRPGLLGTASTMKADFYPQAFREAGLAVEVPPEDVQKLIQHRLFTEIELGDFRDSTREELLQIVEGMKDRQGIDSVILGCTELPLILTRDNELGLPFLNTTAIHVEAIVRCCLAG